MAKLIPPINLLKRYRNTLKRDLAKSRESYKQGAIGMVTHGEHVKNIGLMISQYNQVIKLLKIPQ